MKMFFVSLIPFPCLSLKYYELRSRSNRIFSPGHNIHIVMWTILTLSDRARAPSHVRPCCTLEPVCSFNLELFSVERALTGARIHTRLLIDWHWPHLDAAMRRFYCKQGSHGLLILVFTDIHRCVLALHTQYLPESVKTKSRAYIMTRVGFEPTTFAILDHWDCPVARVWILCSTSMLQPPQPIPIYWEHFESKVCAVGAL